MRRLPAVMTAIGLCLFNVYAHAVTLGRGGLPCVVVIPAQPTAVEKTAGSEFSNYLEEIGLPRPIVLREGE